MNGADYLQQHSAESLSFEEMQQINPLGVHQQQKDEGSQTSEVQQLLEMKEDHPEWSLGLDQQDRESLQIKEEQEELWTNQEGEQHNGLKSLQLHQSQTEDNSEMEPLTSSPAKQVCRQRQQVYSQSPNMMQKNVSRFSIPPMERRTARRSMKGRGRWQKCLPASSSSDITLATSQYQKDSDENSDPSLSLIANMPHTMLEPGSSASLHGRVGHRVVTGEPELEIEDEKPMVSHWPGVKKRIRMEPEATLSPEQEDHLVEWFAAHPFFYDQTARDFKDKRRREQLLDQKAEELGVTGNFLWGWFRNMRTVYGKLRKKKNEQATRPLTARQRWTSDMFKFLDKHMTIRRSSLGKLQGAQSTNTGVEEEEEEEEEEEGDEEPARSSSRPGSPSPVPSSQTPKLKGKKAKLASRCVNKAVLQIPNSMSSLQTAMRSLQVAMESLQAAVGGLSNNRVMYCQYLSTEVGMLTEEQWSMFQQETMGMLIRFRTARQQRQQSAVPVLLPPGSMESIPGPSSTLLSSSYFQSRPAPPQ
ncbi:uncharacterized protein wu:fb74b10 isoform X2 [Maylandia zebra]|uniref:Uncharacterized protein LOC102215007 isoform X2 n=1 Tax=Pundamilia nyererei TaxID=303518 RepID=A0A9Y3VM78_9CICH|nr:uncharacterized protein LOC101469692 isoform X2 [Maylandia zebra]XP_005743437.1 PREDICTED: uncharacterized protein LOC102215007 isoform X2 [Pundamilia nyererei]XP_026033663.1 uncharacterized protein LOC113027986 isoform X2 [Astatotilapia calliptera]